MSTRLVLDHIQLHAVDANVFIRDCGVHLKKNSTVNCGAMNMLYKRGFQATVRFQCEAEWAASYSHDVLPELQSDVL